MCAAGCWRCAPISTRCIRTPRSASLLNPVDAAPAACEALRTARNDRTLSASMFAPVACRHHFAARQHRRSGRRATSRSRSTARPAGSPSRRSAASLRIARSMSLMIDGWMPSVGSSRIRSFGRIASARPIASCCCWPPERSPPRRPSMSFSTGNISKMNGGMPAPALLRREAHLQVLADGEPREDLAALRHVADAERARAYGGSRADAPAVEARCRPSAIGSRPIRHLSSVVLPTPLRPSSVVHCAVGHVERDVAQGMAAAVILVEIRDRQHCQTPASGTSSPAEDMTSITPWHRALLHVLHRAFGEHAAFVQHASRDRRCGATKSMSCSTTTSVVLAREREEELGAAHRLLVGHAGDRLVEQQQSRLLHQQHADLEPLLLAVRQQIRRGRSASAASWIVSSDGSAMPVASPSSRASRGASAARACRPSSRARGSRRPCAARTPSASGTCGRCRACGDLGSRSAAREVDRLAEERGARRRAASCR